jgi:hypothetical protein
MEHPLTADPRFSFLLNLHQAINRIESKAKSQTSPLLLLLAGSLFGICAGSLLYHIWVVLNESVAGVYNACSCPRSCFGFTPEIMLKLKLKPTLALVLGPNTEQ